MEAVSAIKTFVGADGQLRWVARSSSAYRDIDTNPYTHTGEIVSEKALRLWTEYADKTGDYGPLLWAHDEGLRIGYPEASMVHGPFLVEVGRFDDTPLGRKAARYLTEYRNEFGPLGVSIGFVFDRDDAKDAVYDAVLIKERSVLPLATAANPYTQFQAVMKG